MDNGAPSSRKTANQKVHCASIAERASRPGRIGRRLQHETRAGPHVTCAKTSQKNGLRFVCAAKDSKNRRGKQMDSMLAICVDYC